MSITIELRLLAFILLAVYFLVAVTAVNNNAKVWQSTGEYVDQNLFPEKELLSSKPNTAIAFTGGGSRAYLAAMGYLAGLHKLDLLKNVRYIGGISGGAWATTVFSYVQNVPDDDVLLGPIVMPEDLTDRNIKDMDQRCARALAEPDLTFIAVEGFIKREVTTVADAWVYGVSKT
jgi:hypothetical protein